MAVPIDSSRPYRYPSELVALVEAVTRTDPNNESTWIEWKSTLDLSQKRDQCHIAKHVLGFANRTVAVARHHANGLAYLIVGAEPDRVVGITRIDPAILTPRIGRYVGPAVRWRAEYVLVQGRQVLVVVVDPPQNGDPIYPVRQELDTQPPHPSGRILVRRPGSTNPANADEIDQLVERVRAGEGGLEFAINPISLTVERIPDVAVVDELTRIERVATLARPHRTEAPWFALATDVFTKSDDRSEEDYRREVDKYCKLYRRALERRVFWRLGRHIQSHLRLEATNPTDENFSDIVIKLHISGDVRSWPEEAEEFTWSDDEPDLPSRPDVLGTPKSTMHIFDPRRLQIPTFPNVPITRVEPRGPRFNIRDTGSVDIDFEQVDLRPRERLQLPSVPLLVDASEGTVLQCNWTATASNTRGQHTGTFTLTAVASTLELRTIGSEVGEARTTDTT
jgi:hypothetical protein